MFSLIFHFPAGRYHATPWGQNVNEGAVAWPPEPYRILRALIAVWYRKADHAVYDKIALSHLIESLAETPPRFSLPEAVHAHTRHYMPQGRITKGREDTKLVFDAFFRIHRDAELIVTWPHLHLDDDLFALAQHLAERMSYLGRAESLVIARASAEDIPNEHNAFPLSEKKPLPGWTVVDTVVPLSAQSYIHARSALLPLNQDTPDSLRRRNFEATLPTLLVDAIAVETSQIQSAGWSKPPACTFVPYTRPEIGPRAPSIRPNFSPGHSSLTLPKVARLILAGKPRPRIEEAVKLGELLRYALMWKITHGRDACETVPSELLGRDVVTNLPAKGNHNHAYFLSEDADEDGFIDHLVLYANDGLSAETQRALGRLHRLWINEHQPNVANEKSDEGRREWRLALEGFGEVDDFASECRLLRRSRSWVSTTPYLRPWHVKDSDIEKATLEMIQKECNIRRLPLDRATLGGDNGKRLSQGKRSTMAFHRFRSKRNLPQPDRSGTAIVLTFLEPVVGPIALGFGCHYGLGLFCATEP